MRILLLAVALTGVLPAAQAPPAEESAAAVKAELEKLKQAVALLEQRLAATEAAGKEAAEKPKPGAPVPTQAELAAQLREIDERVTKNERDNAVDRLRFSGDYRFESHAISGKVPAHFDGLQLQNLLVKTLFASPILGRSPRSVAEINSTVGANATAYQQFASNLSFDALKGAIGGFPAAQQQQLFGLLMPSTFTQGYKDDNRSLFTNRLRLKFDADVADNVTFTGRLSMYKVFGDSTGVQVFNGQPTSLNIDGTTAGVPNSDILRVDRAYFSWNNIGGSKLYLSIGRRPSTSGPPMNFREDELRGGTPSGSLIDYQFDGITLGYRLHDNIVWRLCWGLGYESGFGNGNVLKLPQDRLKDTHFVGANLDMWETDKTLFQFTYAHAYNVPDGFNGLMVLPRDPLTGEAVTAPVVMRYTPSANLGAIHLAGANYTRKFQTFDLYASGNISSTRPNGKTTPFGGLMSDPFEMPVDRTGYMGLLGFRYRFANDDRTKLGFEYNRGSQYWFNFANAADDIVAPKSNTRGHVVETYLTHRISDRFIFKADFIRYLYDFSGSGWHVGGPKRLDSNPILGFPAYSGTNKFSLGLITRF